MRPNEREKKWAEQAKVALATFAVSNADLAPVMRASDDREAVTVWRRHMETRKPQYRQLAFDTHPDRRGGDEEAFKRVQQSWAILNDEKFPVIARRAAQAAMVARQQQRVVVMQTGFTSGGTSSTTTTGYNGTGTIHVTVRSF